MQTATRRRTTWAVAASLIAHIAVLTLVARQHPMLVIPHELAGPPEPIIPILLTPRAPAAAAHGVPAEIRLHRRAQRTPPNELPVAPLVTPTAPPPAPAPPGPVTVRANPGPTVAEAQQANVRGALQGLVGCADPDAARLSRAQRARCEERLAAGAKDTAFLGLGVSNDKQRLMDAAGAKKEADARYRRAPMPAGSITAPAFGASAEDMANSMGGPPR